MHKVTSEIYTEINNIAEKLDGDSKLHFLSLNNVLALPMNILKYN